MAAQQMAKHWLATDFGGLEVLRFADTEVREPGVGEVTIEVRAAGVNPADYKHFARGDDRGLLPIPIGYEAAGVITAVGPETQHEVGSEVVGFRLRGAWATSVTVPASDVFVKPAGLGFPEAANLLLAGTTASEMLHVTGVQAGETILVHGASGAVGISVIQQAKLLGARVIGTASAKNFAVLERFGAEPVAYGDGLEERVRALAPDGIAAALDTVGTEEAVRVSLDLVADRQRIVTIAAFAAAQEYGFQVIAGAMPASAAYRDSVRERLLALAGEGKLVVLMARTFPLSDALEAIELVRTGHPGGKLALIP